MQPVYSGVDQLVKQIAFQSVKGHAISSPCQSCYLIKNKVIFCTM